MVPPTGNLSGLSPLRLPVNPERTERKRLRLLRRMGGYGELWEQPRVAKLRKTKLFLGLLRKIFCRHLFFSLDCAGLLRSFSPLVPFAFRFQSARLFFPLPHAPSSPLSSSRIAMTNSPFSLSSGDPPAPLTSLSPLVGSLQLIDTPLQFEESWMELEDLSFFRFLAASGIWHSLPRVFPIVVALFSPETLNISTQKPDNLLYPKDRWETTSPMSTRPSLSTLALVDVTAHGIKDNKDQVYLTLPLEIFFGRQDGDPVSFAMCSPGDPIQPYRLTIRPIESTMPSCCLLTKLIERAQSMSHNPSPFEQRYRDAPRDEFYCNVNYRNEIDNLVVRDRLQTRARLTMPILSSRSATKKASRLGPVYPIAAELQGMAEQSCCASQNFYTADL